MKIYVCEEYLQLMAHKEWCVIFATRSLEKALEWEREDEDNRLFTALELEDEL